MFDFTVLKKMYSKFHPIDSITLFSNTDKKTKNVGM